MLGVSSELGKSVALAAIWPVTKTETPWRIIPAEKGNYYLVNADTEQALQPSNEVKNSPIAIELWNFNKSRLQ